MTLTPEQESFRAALEDRLQAIQAQSKTPERLYQPTAYIMGLQAKRMRPLLVFMGYQSQATDIQLDILLPLACAIEMFHNFTLVHDDIMDNAPDRRGQPTVHTRWNTEIAILAGDALLIQAYQELNQLHFLPVFGQMMSLFNRTALEVCEGQVFDLDQTENQVVGIEEYIVMIKLKTAVLLGASLGLGALAGGADNKRVKALQHFGETAGIAFQLQDDYLDLYADPDTFGKQLGGDIIEKKKNILWILAYDSLNSQEQQEMQQQMNTAELSDSQRVGWFKNLYDRTGAGKHALQMSQEFYDRAEQQLREVIPQEKQRPFLLFLEQLQNRQK